MFRLGAAALAAIIGLAASGVFTDTPPSLAHESRAVGNYELVVGFIGEPAFAYEKSGLEFFVTHYPQGVPAEGEHAEGEGPEGTPVEGLEETLEAEIIAGGGAATKPLPIEASFGQPGAYESHLIITDPGEYTFRIFGEIEGQQIDESFTSGPETFGPLEDPQDIQFPELLAAPAVEGESGSESASSESSSSDDTARILGIVGIIVGVVGLGAGVIAVAASRRS
jgi:hypothetical protein